MAKPVFNPELPDSEAEGLLELPPFKTFYLHPTDKEMQAPEKEAGGPRAHRGSATEPVFVWPEGSS